MICASFTSPQQSSTFKNIAHLGDVALIFINGLRLVSVHPSETMVALELLQEEQIGDKISPTSSSFLRSRVFTFS